MNPLQQQPIIAVTGPQAPRDQEAQRAQNSTASELPVQSVAEPLPAPHETDVGPDAGFAKAKHLRKRVDFERVYQQGRRHFSTHLTVFFRRRQAGDAAGAPAAVQVAEESLGSRVGFTVGRALGGAVDRNRLKRRLREAVRLEMFALSTPADVVIHPKRSVLGVDFALLRKEMATAFAAVEQGKGAPPQPRQPRPAKRLKPGAKPAGAKPGSAGAKAR